jgi:hypothetical protein
MIIEGMGEDEVISKYELSIAIRPSRIVVFQLLHQLQPVPELSHKNWIFLGDSDYIHITINILDSKA